MRRICLFSILFLGLHFAGGSVLRSEQLKKEYLADLFASEIRADEIQKTLYSPDDAENLYQRLTQKETTHIADDLFMAYFSAFTLNEKKPTSISGVSRKPSTLVSNHLFPENQSPQSTPHFSIFSAVLILFSGTENAKKTWRWTSHTGQAKKHSNSSL